MFERGNYYLNYHFLLPLTPCLDFSSASFICFSSASFTDWVTSSSSDTPESRAHSGSSDSDRNGVSVPVVPIWRTFLFKSMLHWKIYNIIVLLIWNKSVYIWCVGYKCYCNMEHLVTLYRHCYWVFTWKLYIIFVVIICFIKYVFVYYFLYNKAKL